MVSLQTQTLKAKSVTFPLPWVTSPLPLLRTLPPKSTSAGKLSLQVETLITQPWLGDFGEDSLQKMILWFSSFRQIWLSSITPLLFLTHHIYPTSPNARGQNLVIELKLP